jgi:hypothetical protein
MPDSAPPPRGLDQQWPAINLVLDRIATLLPHDSHPASEKIEQQCIEWFDSTRLVRDPVKRERIRSAEIGRGTAAAFPHVSREAALFWACFSLWYTSFDDAYAEDNAMRDLLGYFQNAGDVWLMLHDTLPEETSHGPLVDSLRELLGRLDSLASPTLACRVRQSTRDYLFAGAWEAVLRANNMPLPRDKFVSLWRHGTQFMLNLEFVEIAPGAFLRDDQRRAPLIRQMRAAACDMMTAANSLCSSPYEEQHGVLFGPQLAGPPLSPAERALDDTHQCLTQARVVAEIRDTTAGDPSIGAFCAAVASWAAGGFWWHRKALSGRYRTS